MQLTPRIYFCFAPDCDACAQAEPEFDRFLRDNPLAWGFKVNVNAPNPSVLSAAVRYTPTYLIVDGGEVVWKHEGGLKAAQIEKVWQRGGSP